MLLITSRNHIKGENIWLILGYLLTIKIGGDREDSEKIKHKKSMYKTLIQKYKNSLKTLINKGLSQNFGGKKNA